MTPMPADDIDLLIVGAGPAGLLASIIASTIGLSHRVIERRGGLHTEPSAHVLKTHTMEVYRRIGVAGHVVDRATPIDLQRYVTWCESVAGLVYGRLDLSGKKGRVSRFTEISSMHPANLPQSQLEPVLHARAKELAQGGDPVTFNATFKTLQQDDASVTATVETADGLREIRARFLVGADGAGSAVRRAAGIAIEGPQALAYFLAIHINSDVRPFLNRNPGVLFFVRKPGFDGIFIMHQPVGSQVLMMRYDPNATSFESFDDAVCRSIVAAGFGSPHEFSIAAIDRWAMSAQVAAEYRKSRVLLAGDAAHRFPPTGGLGLNTGVEDVENLIWKIGAVLRGEADLALLDSYAAECRPVALRNTGQSVSNHARMREVSQAIGAEEDDAAFQAVIDGLCGDPHHPRFATIGTAIEAQLPHFAFLELEMAATATEGAIIPPGRAVALPVPAVEGYQPSFTPGHHIPHFWLAPDRSTIDALRFDRFTLFAPADALDGWHIAAGALPKGVMPVDIVPIAPTMSADRVTVADLWGGAPYAVLARPDGRIAWIEPEHMSDRGAALAEAIAQVTGRALAAAATVLV